MTIMAMLAMMATMATMAMVAMMTMMAMTQSGSSTTCMLTQRGYAKARRVVQQRSMPRPVRRRWRRPQPALLSPRAAPST